MSKIKNTQTYHLSNYDNSRTPLVITTLNGENYRTRVISIKIGLHAKTKLGFMDGTIKKPSTQSKEYYNLGEEKFNGDDVTDQCDKTKISIVASHML